MLKFFEFTLKGFTNAMIFLTFEWKFGVYFSIRRQGKRDPLQQNIFNFSVEYIEVVLWCDIFNLSKKDSAKDLLV